MALVTYPRTLVQDDVNLILASHHNNQENQLKDLTDTVLAIQDLPIQSVLFGSVNAGTNVDKPIFVAPSACQLVSMSLVNATNITANAMNFTKLELVNKGANGSGTAIIAIYDGAVDSLTAFDVFVRDAVTVLNGGDVLSLRKTDSGAGAAVTDLLCAIRFKNL